MKREYKKAYNKLKPLITGTDAYTINELCERTGYKKSLVYYVIGIFRRWGVEYRTRSKTGEVRVINQKTERQAQREEAEKKSEPAKIEAPEPLVNYTDLAIGCRIGVRGSFATYRVVAIDARLDYCKLQDTDNENNICTASALMLKPIELSNIVADAEIGEADERGRRELDKHNYLQYDGGGWYIWSKSHKFGFDVRYLHEIDYLMNFLK